MYGVIVIIISTWISLMCTVVSQDYLDLARFYKNQSRVCDQRLVAERLRADYRKYGKIYTSYADIINDNPDLRFTSDRINYAVSNELDDGMWSYRRFVLFSQDARKKISESDFLSASTNMCGTRDFYEASSWCVRQPNAKWWMAETREDYIQRIKKQHTRLEKTLKKFVRFYNKEQQFPVTKPDMSTLSPGERIDLPSFVGYSGSAENCDGPYDLNGIPLDCDDIFDSRGNKVYYSLKNDSSMFLVVSTEAESSSGSDIYASEGVQIN